MTREAENDPQWSNVSLIDRYFKSFRKIKPDRQGWVKPYQYVLLLSIIELVEQNLIQEDKRIIFDDSDTLISVFCHCLLPFLPPDLRTQKKHYNLWDPIRALERKRIFFDVQYKDLMPRNQRIRTVPQIKQYIEYITLNNDFCNALQDQYVRQQLTNFIVSTFLEKNSQDFNYILQINQNLEEPTNLEKSWVDFELKPTKKTYLKREILRDHSFREGIVQNYNYECAVCGLKTRSSEGYNIVDSAHIKPLAIFNDNQLDNGICLCKNHHWAFDQGLFTIEHNYSIKVSTNFEETSPNSKPIQNFHGAKIYLPKKVYPRTDALQWHQDNVFIA